MAVTMKDLAEKDKRVSLIWANFAIQALNSLDGVLKSKGSPASFTNSDLPGFLHHVRNALQTHFNINTAAAFAEKVIDVANQYYRTDKQH